MSLSTESAADATVRDAFLGRLTQSCLGMLDIATIYVGERLGLYRALVDSGASTSAELASRTGTHERYVREWLEQQVVSAVLEVDDAATSASRRRYSMPAGHAEVLLDADSPNFMGPYPRQLFGTVRPLEALIDAFRDGGGVPYEAYGADCRDGIAAGNRVAFINLLGSQWFPAIPDLDARLRADPPARIADVGCGFGWSAISIARAYPLVRVDAFDLDETSVKVARQNAEDAGLAGRIDFQVRDAADPGLGHAYDLVTAFETLHDMARPVQALKAMRGLVTHGGIVLVVDEKVGDQFSADPGDIERLYYGFSVLHCLPASMATQPSAATGTVMRPSILREYARQAGFGDVEILPVDHDFWRFYRLIV